MAINLKAPVASQQYQAASGTTYTADANGYIKNIVAGDVFSLLHEGCLPTSSVQAQSANGLYPTPLRLLEMKNTDGSALAASASSGKFGVSSTLGTSFALISEAANNATKTDAAIIEYVLPSSYVAGSNITATVNASIAGSGTLTTKTAQIKAYRVAKDGTEGADIGPGAASAMTAAGADVPFTVTGTSLNPGDKIIFSLTAVLTETASSNMTASINSIILS